MMKRYILASVVSAVVFSSAAAQQENRLGKKIFETYCWGCHHQTAVAFGPPFREIAARRSAAEIRAMIADPVGVSKALGYKRNAMPKLDLSVSEIEAITAYILSFKPEQKGAK